MSGLPLEFKRVFFNLVREQKFMNKNIFRKKLLLIIAFLFLLLGVSKNISAQEGELGDESWTVEERVGRLFYFTHGTVVWGHEFGFFKGINDYDVDTLWLTFSSSNEKVKTFIGKDVVISLAVDGQNFKIKTPMLSAGTIGITHIMTFTNLRADDLLIDALTKGRYVKVQILEPKELEVLLDIKEDQFGLKGFTVCRKKAGKVCKDSLTGMGGESSREK